MSRGNLRQYLTCGPNEDKTYVCRVQRLWLILLATMRDSSVVDRQMTAACNAICVFLHSATSSPSQSVQIFAMSSETWTAVFEALVDKFGTSKPKPLRQVLSTLMKILGQYDDRNRAQSIQDGILSRMASIILLGKPISHFKTSMIVFEAFIRFDVPVARLLSAIGRGHGSICDRWEHCLRRHEIDATELCAVMSCYAVDQSICHFSFSILMAIADSSAQATAGSFFTSLVLKLAECGISFESLWIEHVVTILQRYPQAIEAFKNYFLPSIFKLHPDHCHELLHRLACKDKESSMLQNALTIAIMGCNMGLLSEEGTFSFGVVCQAASTKSLKVLTAVIPQFGSMTYG